MKITLIIVENETRGQKYLTISFVADNLDDLIYIFHRFSVVLRKQQEKHIFFRLGRNDDNFQLYIFDEYQFFLDFVRRFFKQTKHVWTAEFSFFELRKMLSKLNKIIDDENLTDISKL